MLAAAVHGVEIDAVPAVQRADALRPVELVRADGNEIGADFVDLDRELAGGLDGVGVEGNPAVATALGDGGHRIDAADFVVTVDHGNDGRLVAQAAGDVVGIGPSVGVDRQPFDSERGGRVPVR